MGKVQPSLKPCSLVSSLLNVPTLMLSNTIPTMDWNKDFSTRAVIGLSAKEEPSMLLFLRSSRRVGLSPKNNLKKCGRWNGRWLRTDGLNMAMYLVPNLFIGRTSVGLCNWILTLRTTVPTLLDFSGLAAQLNITAILSNNKTPACPSQSSRLHTRVKSRILTLTIW